MYTKDTLSQMDRIDIEKYPNYKIFVTKDKLRQNYTLLLSAADGMHQAQINHVEKQNLEK